MPYPLFWLTCLISGLGSVGTNTRLVFKPVLDMANGYLQTHYIMRVKLIFSVNKGGQKQNKNLDEKVILTNTIKYVPHLILDITVRYAF